MSRVMFIISFTTVFAFGQLVVNEIMFMPTTGFPEWFEILNISDTDVDLTDWLYSDIGEGSSHDPVLITTDEFIIPAGSHIVVADFEWEGFGSCKTIIPGSWRTLNNSGSDGVRLWAPDTSLVDSASYTAEDYSCMNHGISLECIDPYSSSTEKWNWNCSIDTSGATPCRENSMQGIEYSEDVFIDISPNPFDPETENSAILVITPIDARVEVRIYSLRGRLVKDFSSAYSITWDGRDDDENPVPTGPYVVVAQVESNGKTKHHKAAIAVARGMK